MSDIVLSAGVRQNLLALQNTARLMGITQNRLATGKKVNSALDNPVNFFTASGLNSRANDLSALLDAMSNGIKTIEAADNGITAINRTIEAMKSTLLQARQDKSFKSTTHTIDAAAVGTTIAKNLTFSGGAVGGSINVAVNQLAAPATPATLTAAGGTNLTGDPDLSALNGQTVSISGTVVYTFTNAVSGQAAALEAGIEAAAGGGVYTATRTAAGIDISRADGVNFTVTASNAAAATAIGIPSGTTSTDGVPAVTAAVKTVDELVAAINTNVSLVGKVQATNDSGRLRLMNLSTTDLTVAGINAGGVIDGSASTATIGGNDVRRNLVKQFNDLRDQLDKLADDASYNGVNLLRGDKLKITFNETGTSTIEVQAKDPSGVVRPINSLNLNIIFLQNSDVDADSSIDALVDNLAQSANIVRAQASDFGSTLSIVQNRTEFTRAMINTLQNGADNLVLTDTNEEGANMLALQTRQQLSTTALSLASQADQAVLRVFG
jgi:flagellin-like hook-associated protein FlgL